MSARDALGQPVFYYDLGSPECYIVAERIMTALPVFPEWEPVLGSRLGATDARPDLAALERFPPDAREAMLAATYAKQIGRAVAFSLAAFRQAFAGGRDLGERDTVLIAGAACEMHPTAILKGIRLRSTVQALETAGQRAIVAGVRSLPAIEVNGELFEGEGGLDEAAQSLGALT